MGYTKGSHPSMPKGPTAKGDGIREANKAPERRTAVSKPRDPGRSDMVRGDGLKTAWADQTSKPSLMVPTARAREKVR